jgi:hypothetical protein
MVNIISMSFVLVNIVFLKYIFKKYQYEKDCSITRVLISLFLNLILFFIFFEMFLIDILKELK